MLVMSRSLDPGLNQLWSQLFPVTQSDLPLLQERFDSLKLIKGFCRDLSSLDCVISSLG